MKYQGEMTPNQIINDLKNFIDYYKEEQGRIPLCMIEAINYINWLERRINEKNIIDNN